MLTGILAIIAVIVALVVSGVWVPERLDDDDWPDAGAAA
jgi:hypothetical protein